MKLIKRKYRRVLTLFTILFVSYCIYKVVFIIKLPVLNSKDSYNIQINGIDADISGIRINDSIMVINAYNIIEKRPLYRKDLNVGDILMKEPDTDTFYIVRNRVYLTFKLQN